MTINKDTFNYIKEMINNDHSINSMKGFCKGLGINNNVFSSPVYISDNQISITYRRNTHYVRYNHSKIHGTIYFNNL